MKKYEFPLWQKIVSIISILFFGCFIILSYLADTILGQSIFALFFIMSFFYVFEVFSYVEIDSSGIFINYTFGNNKRAFWDEIANVIERDLMQRLDVFDSSNKKLLHINHQINDYISILNQIEEKLPNLHEDKIQYEFLRQKYFSLLFIILSLFPLSLLIYFFMQGEDLFNLAVFGFFSLLGVIAYFSEYRRMVIDYNGITLFYPIKQKKILREDIVKISHEFDSGEYGSKHSLVYIYLNNQKPLKLGGFTVDENVVYASLKKILNIE